MASAQAAGYGTTSTGSAGSIPPPLRSGSILAAQVYLAARRRNAKTPG